MAYWASTEPNATYLIWDQPGVRRISYSYVDLIAAVASASRMLTQHGIGKGHRFCVHLRNRPETVALLFAAARVGAVLIPTNIRFTPRELGYVLEHSLSSLVVTEPAHEAMVAEAVGKTHRPTQVLTLGNDPISDPSVLFATRAEESPSIPIDTAADLVVMYTSGTTSNPKGVRISQLALLNAGHAITAGIGFESEDRHLAALPLFHINSLCYTLMSSLVTGGSVVLSDRFSASKYFRQAAETGATYGWMAATPMRMLLAQAPSTHDHAHSLRRIVFGQNLTAQEFRAWSERFGAPLQQIYGMTETVSLPIMTPLYGLRPLHSMGRPALGVVARLDVGKDPVSGRGQSGELLLRLRPGAQMMSGYLDDPVATAAAFDGEWFRTGDIVRVDEDGFFHFIDRKGDVFKISGENVSASEIETVLNEHPMVFDSAVVGQDDLIKGQVAKAFVVLKANAVATAAELIAWCRGRLALFKVPVEIEFRDDFPRTSAGKTRKKLLQQGAKPTEDI